jgi:hypothetical protein
MILKKSVLSSLYLCIVLNLLQKQCGSNNTVDSVGNLISGWDFTEHMYHIVWKQWAVQ